MTNLADQLRRIPFFRFLLPYTAGILTGFSVKGLPMFTSFAGLLVLFTLLFAFRQTNYRTAPVFGVLLYIFLFLFGWFWYQQREYHPKIIPQKAFYFAAVTRFPEAKANSCKTVLKMLPDRQKVLTYLEIDSVSDKLIPGQVIAFHRQPEMIQPPTNPGEFNYRAYMFRRNISYRLFLRTGEYVVTTGKVHLNLREKSLMIREHLLNIFSRYGFSGDEMGILSALVLGDRGNITPEIKEAFANSGAIHILAVSGLHVGIIYFVVSYLLKFLAISRRGRGVRLVILLSVIWVYAFITGLSPSVQRAATMFSFIAIGENINRQNHIYNTLAASAFLLLLIDPMLLFEVGFQLSYAAVLSIVFFQPLLYHSLYTGSWWLDKLWGLLTVSLAAQVGVSPLSIYYFHQFPVYFWLTNLFAIPLTTCIIYTAFLLLSLSFLPVAAHILALLLHLFAKGLITSVEMVNTLPGATIPNISITVPMLFFAFLLIIALTLLIIQKKSRHLLWVLLLLTILNGMATYNRYHILQQHQLVLFNVPRKILMAAVHGTQVIWISSEDRETTRQKMAIYMKPFEQMYGTKKSIVLSLPEKKTEKLPFLEKQNDMINFAGMKIWIPREGEIPEILPAADLVYLHRVIPGAMTKFIEKEHPAMQFITNTPLFSDKQVKKGGKIKIGPQNIHVLSETGALRITILPSRKSKKNGIKIGYITH